MIFYLYYWKLCLSDMPNSFQNCSSGFCYPSFPLSHSSCVFLQMLFLFCLLHEGFSCPLSGSSFLTWFCAKGELPTGQLCRYAAQLPFCEFSTTAGGCDSSWPNSQCPVGVTTMVFSRNFFREKSLTLNSNIKPSEIIKSLIEAKDKGPDYHSVTCLSCPKMAFLLLPNSWLWCIELLE